MCKFISHQEYFIFKTAVNQRQSQTQVEVAGVSGITNDLVTNQINVWSSTSGSLSWVGGSGAHLHIQRTVNTKWGKGVELHSRYFKQGIIFKGKMFKYVISVIKDEF